MGGHQIDLLCPLCCDKTFDSKQSLFDHLNYVKNNLYCSLCNRKYNTLDGLLEHLNLYDCQTAQDDTVQNIVIYEQGVHVQNIENLKDSKDDDINALTELNTTNTGTQYITDETYTCQDSTGEVSKMYVELLNSKQMSKPVLETGELKLIKDEGESRYMIVTQNNGELQEDTAVLTKQNHDGTISLTTVKDVKLESETLIAPEPDSGNNQEETYSCNACKVSFTSVIDHIQNYHNDQEVVIEDIIPMDFDSMETEEALTTTDNKQAPRRVITDTGDIVEEPVIFKAENTEIAQNTIDEIIKHPKLVLDKQGRAYTKRYVQIDKLENVNNTPTKAVKSDPSHKVVSKDLLSKTGFTVKMYNCMSCNMNVSNLDELLTHPCKSLKYPCTRCPAAYSNPMSLCAHMKVHKTKPDGSPDVPVSYECKICNTVFPTNKSLKLHKRMHDPVKIRPIEPPVENTDGTDTNRSLYRCNICEKLIPFDYRTVHENSHKAGDKMNCSICNKKFTSIEYLEMHMNVHNLDKVTVNKPDKKLPYNCLYCSRKFARPHEKVKHERIHTGEKPHSCEICGKSFRVSYCLTLHMRTHTGARPYACPHCGKRFKAHSVYNHHLLTHSEVRAYKCPYCPKAFKTSVQLAGHKNSHTKPFSCQQCNRPFASLYAVRVHTETHSRQNNLKFSCSLCGASYARAFALKDHVKQAHQDNQDHHAHDSLLDNRDDNWMSRENTTDTVSESLDKELQEEITELEMSTNELIVP